MRKGALAAAAFLLPLFVWACGGGGDLAGPETADDQLTQPSFAATAYTDQGFREFISSPQWNPCTEEFVVFYIRLQVVYHETQDAAGGTHINGSANFQGSYGVGQTSGLTYHLVARSYQGWDGPWNVTNGAEPGVFLIPQRWIAEGSADDYSLLVLYTLIINADGEVVLENLKVAEQCGNVEL